MKRLSALIAATIAAVMTLPASAAELEVREPWVVLAPPGAYATAAFMELHNAGEVPVDVVEADAPGFETVELHRSFNEDGMHRMVRQDRISVPAGESVALAPGGLHIMLIGPETAPAEGERIAIELRFDDGSTQTVEAVVRPREARPAGHGHGDHHHH
ncbi:copper chaperone PCu(A)C [Guyparkeria halophila]|uniref:Copper chaperone PCu(A)C n=1 Tax=Guyparkeria halophila TaxID=47960 RepID=A0ABZ0YXJ0_9GAMM|nr:copper chaperone PCu(A)C [Guyparkeria halophila]WQH15952.1 copper chaperone PCu(A)C [Guyparkeria halophila]